MTTISNRAPAPAATNVATGTTLYFELDDPDGVDEPTLIVALDSLPILFTNAFSNDADLTIGSNQLVTSGAYTFTPDDVGKTVFIRSTNYVTLTGTVSVSGTAVTGTGTDFLTSLSPGDWVRFGSETRVYEVASITSNLSMTLVTSHAIAAGLTLYREFNSCKATITSFVSTTTVTTSHTFVITESNVNWSLRNFATDWTGTITPDGSGGLDVLLTPPDHLLGSHVYTEYVEIRDLVNILDTFTWNFTTGSRPYILSVDPITGDPFGREIRLLISELLTFNLALSDSTNYILSAVSGSPALPAVQSVTPVNVGPNTRLDVRFVSPLTNNGNYLITINNTSIFATSGNKLQSPPGNQKTFTGYGPFEDFSLIKDSLVQTPSIDGPIFINYQLVQANMAFSYTILDLDTDVTSVILGPNSSGIVSLSGFVNNMDGTGSIQIVFSSLIALYSLSIIAIDNVDNQSNESNILKISFDSNTVPGTVLSIRPMSQSWGDVYNRMLNDVPVSGTTLRSGFVIPYSYYDQPFILKVIDIGKTVFISVSTEGISGKPSSKKISVIPERLEQLVYLPVSKGRNYISANDGIRSDTIICSATVYAMTINAIALELYRSTILDLDVLTQEIFSPVSTRLAEPYILFGDLLPDIRPQKTLATKLAINAFVNYAGKHFGVENLLTGLTLQTPIFVPTQNDYLGFDPILKPLYNSNEHFSGVNIHTWIHNFCVNRWEAFYKFINNFPSVFNVLSASEDHITFIDENQNTVTHNFDATTPDCSSLALTNFCLEDILVNFRYDIVMNMSICAASYPFDLCYTESNPIGAVRSTFDSGIVWDSGLTLDEFNYLDPGNDGWVGFCFLDRWDSIASIELFPASGSVTGSTNLFTSSAHYFAPADIGKRIEITNSGLGNNGMYFITGYVSSTQVKVSTIFAATESSLDWKLITGYSLDSMGPQPATLYHPHITEREYYSGSVVASSNNFKSTGRVFSSYDIGKHISIINSTLGNNGFAKITALVAADEVTTDVTFSATEIGLSWNLYEGIAEVSISSDIFTVPNGHQFSIDDVSKAITINSGPNLGEYIIVEYISPTVVRVNTDFVSTQSRQFWELNSAKKCVYDGYFAITAVLESADIPINAAAVIAADADIV